jgi:hypothetical protein
MFGGHVARLLELPFVVVVVVVWRRREEQGKSVETASKQDEKVVNPPALI